MNDEQKGRPHAVKESINKVHVSSARVPVAELTRFCRDALSAVGMNTVDSSTTADALVMADTMGVYTHGTKLLVGYLRRLKGGGYDAKAQPRIDREGPGWAVIEGGNCLGQVAGVYAVNVATTKARAVGVAYIAVRNTGHIGAAGYYAAVAARQGFVVMVTGNDMPSVAAPGSRTAVLGSNPIALGIPRPPDDPIVLDMATSAVAGGKVYAACQRGEPIDPTWLIGPDGRPTTDGTLYPHQAALAPAAGHKGYGLGLWAEILSAVLPGGAITWQVGSWIFDEPEKPSRHNMSLIAIDVATIAPPDEYAARVRQLADEIHRAPTAEGVPHVLLPGEREWKLRQSALDAGIPLPPDVREKLREASAIAGVEATWLNPAATT